MRFEYRGSHLSETWIPFEDNSNSISWMRLLNAGWTDIKAKSKGGLTIEFREAPEPPECKHENYTYTTSQLFKKGKDMDGQSHSYICSDCGVVFHTYKDLKAPDK